MGKNEKEDKGHFRRNNETHQAVRAQKFQSLFPASFTCYFLPKPFRVERCFLVSIEGRFVITVDPKVMKLNWSIQQRIIIAVFVDEVPSAGTVHLGNSNWFGGLVSARVKTTKIDGD